MKFLIFSVTVLVEFEESFCVFLDVREFTCSEGEGCVKVDIALPILRLKKSFEKLTYSLLEDLPLSFPLPI